MEGQKLKEAKRGVTLFLGRLKPGRRDHAGLVTFSDTVEVKVELGPLSSVANQILESVDMLSASGHTALIDGIMKALSEMPHETEAIRAIVVFTDGLDNKSTSTASDILSTLATFGLDPPRVYCLSYGDDANSELLDQIARVSQGVTYAGTYFGIEELFERIGYHF